MAIMVDLNHIEAPIILLEPYGFMIGYKDEGTNLLHLLDCLVLMFSYCFPFSDEGFNGVRFL